MDNEFSYDRLPYPSKFFVQMHPERLATHATLFGMTPAPVNTARVLELGCGNGSHLVSLAFLFPEAAFLGIDLSKRHIDDAKAAAARLGLANCEFKQIDVMEMSAEDFGSFDYITAHGLFSWIPDVVRVKVLEVCRELLSPNGVGYLSYSVYPGHHQREMVQQAMRFYAAGVADPVEKVDKAVAFLKFLTENTLDGGIYKAALSQELKRHERHAVADIFHDDLSDVNQAFYFHEFAGMLDKAGLHYLGEAELAAMNTFDISRDARAFLDSRDNVIEREQHLDFLRGRIFRQTLLCHKEVPLQRSTTPSIIERFMIASPLRPLTKHPDLASANIEKFGGPNNAVIEIDQPLAKAMLALLGAAWGRAIPFSELVEDGKRMLVEAGYQTSDWKEQEHYARAILLQIAQASSLVSLHVYQPHAFTEVSEKPTVNDLSRWQMESTQHILTLLAIDMKIEDAVSRKLLDLLDGTRDRERILADLTEFINTADGITGRKELIRALPGWLDESLLSLAAIGVFAA